MEISGITYKEGFIEHPDGLYEYLLEHVDWDERMSARTTASFGQAYNYSQMSYPYQEFSLQLDTVRKKVGGFVAFEPNNCLINLYPNGNSKMGFHSDQTDILESDTGVAIVSLGEERTIRYRNINDPSLVKDYSLSNGSLIYMSNQVQEEWQHAIPKSKTEKGRMSLTFRQLLITN